MNPGADTQQRILNAARELIYARSYAEVGVAAICEQAGVKKGSFYHFYPSKRELTLAVLDTYYVQMKAQLLDAAFLPDRPPMARIARLGQLAYEFQKTIMDETGQLFGCPFGNLASELSTQDEPIRQKVSQIFAKLRAGLRQTLEEAQASGEVADMDPEATAHAMLAYFEGVMLMAKTQNDPRVLRDLLPAMLQIRITPQHV